jgi:hypothetical protein
MGRSRKFDSDLEHDNKRVVVDDQVSILSRIGKNQKNHTNRLLAFLFKGIAHVQNRTIVGAIACLAFGFHPMIADASGLEAARLLGPPPGDEATEILAGFYLSDLTSIEGEHELCVFEGVLTLTWLDSRQAFDTEALGLQERIYQGGFQFSEVYDGWWPQLILSNESGDFSRRGNLLRITPDGMMTYIEELDISAKSPMKMGAFPFDQQTCTASFEVLGFDASEVLLSADSRNSGHKLTDVSVADWRFTGLTTSTTENNLFDALAGQAALSTLHVNIQVERDPGFIIRLIVLPLIMLVMLSWSVFWMDSESLGNRMDISFVGILTVVAFQILVSGQLPHIPYFTLMSTFLYINYLLLFCSVIVNLVVGRLDRSDRRALGNRIDVSCRWVFPASYFGLIGLAALFFL